MPAKLLLCSCGGSQDPDRDAIAAATGLACSRVHSALCGREVDRAAAALKEAEGEVIVACAQEAETFAALAEELGQEPPLCVDIRDRAGWSDEAGAATPKIAALLAAAQLPRTPARTVDVASEGLCLVLGAAEAALPAAERLAATLSVTCLLTEAVEIPPAPVRRFDLAAGRVRAASGAFGGFRVTVDGYRAASYGGRGGFGFTAPRDGGETRCDVIVDLRGGDPLFPAHLKRDGYLRADPGDRLAVERALFDASHLTGVFEKTLHVRLEESLCAHSRAKQTGCTRCLDLCPTGAILPDGDAVKVDAAICAGCGACSAACPSGAISFDDPPVPETLTAIRTLASAYRAAGGVAQRLLVHDAEHGREMISLAARFGRGLPADVLPLELPSVAAFGHAEAMTALATGFAAVRILLSPRTERSGLEAEAALAEALLSGLGAGEGRVELIEPTEPDALSDALYGGGRAAPEGEPILPLGRRRDATRLAARALAGGRAVEPIPLPAGAPYGAVLVNRDACTLCLSCAGLCPSGALGDNPDRPQLTFREDACLQCGLCAAICPEDAITLAPRLDISDAALRQQVVHEEEPYCCIECGKPFGVKSTIERIVEKLSGVHPMFVNSDNAKLIRMCDDCRVRAQYHEEAAPFRFGERPRVRTTDDYLKDRDKT